MGQQENVSGYFRDHPKTSIFSLTNQMFVWGGESEVMFECFILHVRGPEY